MISTQNSKLPWHAESNLFSYSRNTKMRTVYFLKILLEILSLAKRSHIDRSLILDCQNIYIENVV